MIDPSAPFVRIVSQIQSSLHFSAPGHLSDPPAEPHFPFMVQLILHPLPNSFSIYLSPDLHAASQVLPDYAALEVVS